ncbi:hypothetical protein LUZ63_013790 [Rhynchospora breviuscula]|uniref:Uncharacterized protein n=1 Tax=Rhynchospora breviuscula TaxID=2022672 RepID=A0A9Q0C987_9POAL|nr:hypothetical protein LUZ63_013790 [Rhynchospora breviuscula]
MLVTLSIFPKNPRNISIFRFLSSNGADKGCGGVRQIGSIHVQRLWKGHLFGITSSWNICEGSERVRYDKVVPFGLLSDQVEPDWFSGGYKRGCFSKDKEALRSLEAGASSSENKKRDRGSASPSNDSQMKKLKSADKEALGNLDAGASSNKDKKRDCGSASPSTDSQMKKLKSADKEALGNLDPGASSSKDKKRDCGSASPSNDFQRKKRKSADKEALGNLDAGASSNNNKDKRVSAETKDGQVKFSVSEIEDNYKDASLAPNWKTFQTVIFNVKRDGLHDSAKIAAFDFDGCLAKTSVKRIGADAWSLMYPSIPKKLQGLYNDGYKLVIFTNESNIDRWKNKRQVAVDSKIGRLENFIKRVEVPIQVFIACGIRDLFRKPSTGMWTLLKEHFNSGVAIDMHQSFYVGDAAGREKDHSDADIEFAKAIGLKFYVPEEYFDVE